MTHAVVGEDGPGHEMERSLMEGEDSLLELRGKETTEAI
jgi:hypothetical protein